MGYTHYYDQKRSLTKAEWLAFAEVAGTITRYVQHELGIPLANGLGEPGTQPEWNTVDSYLSFNGLGDDSHESLYIQRKRETTPQYTGDTNPSWSFCKTARKPYDIAVTAILAYLATCTRKIDHDGPVLGTEAFAVSSDGDASEWLEGVDLVRQALPHLANMIDIPMPIMESERWVGPWVNIKSKNYDVHFCVDGKGYVRSGSDWYCFPDHASLAKFLDKTKRVRFSRDYYVSFGSSRENYRVEPDIWKAYGAFDSARHDRISKAQIMALKTLFPVTNAENKQLPPAFVRPGQMLTEVPVKNYYSIKEMLDALEAA